MKILVFGSLNIDRTYSVPHFVAPGETLAADKLQIFCGGKGFNQAIALARAGNQVYFAGGIGTDGQMLINALKEEKINIDHLKHTSGSSGHAIIQVTPDGQNSILIQSGANGEITPADVAMVLENFGAGDLIVLQNEISCVAEIMEEAKEKGLVVAMNPSPLDERIKQYPLEKVDYLFVNQGEGCVIANAQQPEQILENLHVQYPQMNVVLTLGGEGSCYLEKNGKLSKCGIYAVAPVDTTAAGDTFSGYFLSMIIKGADARSALWTAAVASGLAVSRPGASSSIPTMEEVRSAMENQILA